MIECQEHFFADSEQMFQALERRVADALMADIAGRGSASLVAAGGTTPRPLYVRLADLSLDWRRVHITLSDELWVATEDPRSNEHTIRSTLLARGAAARFFPLKTAAPTAQAAEAAVGAALAALPLPFSITLLGMGADGHTASLYPHAAGLKAALDPRGALVRAIAPVDASRGERLSLSLAGVLRSRRIALLIRGEAKLKAYRAARAGDDLFDMPVRAVLQQQEVPVELYWAP